MTEVRYSHSLEFHNEQAALKVLPFIQSLIPIKSIVDIGTGTGSWLSAAKKLGVQHVLGIDGIKVDKSMFQLEDKEFILHNLNDPIHLDQKFDLCICLEVVEHLPASAAGNLIDIMTGHADIILFSAAIPGQTGDHHINEQWPAYWQELFEKRGYQPYDILRDRFWDDAEIDWWYRQNMLIYSKTQIAHFPKTENVRAYLHPELLNLKDAQIARLQYIIKDHVEEPRFLSSLKKVMRSTGIKF